jgi:ABC-type multidrug transport system fused ATPase/permease subunit
VSTQKSASSQDKSSRAPSTSPANPGSSGNGDGAAAPSSTAPSSTEILAKVAEGLSNTRLLLWMFRFMRPVLGLAFIAVFWLTLFIAVETLMNRQAGMTVNQIRDLGSIRVGWITRQQPNPNLQFLNFVLSNQAGATPGFWSWIRSSDFDARALRHLIGGLIALVLSYALLRYLREVSNSKMSMNMVYYIREAIYDKLQRVGFGFHDAMSSGQLINRALTDLNNVRMFVMSSLTVVEIVLVVLFNIALIYTRNHWIAVLSLIPLPIWTLYILRFSNKVQPAAKSVMEAEDKNISIITENIAGVHVVKAFATEEQEKAKYGSNCDTFKERVLKRIRLYTNFQPIIRSIAQASHLSLFLAAAILAIKGKLGGPGDFLILGAALGAILSRLQNVAPINEQYQNAIVSARRLYEVLMAPPTVPEKPDAKPLPKDGTGEVVFENVTFGYDPAKPVLHDISFRVTGGSVVAIVGPTGAGKTTLVNLVARFYDPQQGRVVIDGIDVRDAKLSSLRTQVTCVFQETYLFSDTVAANIAYGRPNVTLGEIESAARLAQAHEFIEAMPKQYEAPLRERGADLSGGQKQRLAIARAIVTNPRVLVLDDATAAIDPETEDLIRRAMGFVMKGRTTFIIAHRISTVKRADLVVVVEHGRVAQLGTHDELMEQEGHYRDIAVAQLYGEDEEEAPPVKPRPEHPSHMKRVQAKEVVATAKDAVERGAESEDLMGK